MKNQKLLKRNNFVQHTLYEVIRENSKLDESKTNDSQITEIAPEESKDNYEKGTLTDTSFESKYLNLKFDLPEGYTMFTEQQLFA